MRNAIPKIKNKEKRILVWRITDFEENLQIRRIIPDAEAAELLTVA